MENSDCNLIEYLERELLHKNYIHKEIDKEILSKIDIIGFDVDHTLSLYNTEGLIELLYTSFAKFLVEHKNYPKEILIFRSDGQETDEEVKSNYKFQQDFVHKYSSTEVIVDIPNGNVIKLDQHNFIIKAYHGTDELSQIDLEKYYGAEKKFSEFNFECKGTDNYQLIIGNFEFHVIPLFSICVHLFDNSDLKYAERIKNYKDIYNDIIEALIFNYDLYDKEKKCIKKMKDSGYFYPELMKNPKKYLLEYSAKEVLEYLRKKGLAVFFATNSFYEYADFIMRNTIGENYLDYFDIGFYYCKKPSFFFQNKHDDAYFIDTETDNNKSTKPPITHRSIHEDSVFEQAIKEKKVVEGNYRIIEEFYKKFLRKDQLKFIYVGDSFYSDTYHTSKLENWECIAVCEHIHTGFIGNNPADFKKIWEIENNLGITGTQKESVFFTNIIRDHTLFTVSNVDALKYLK